ncbi:MAG: divalent metal cation transporter [Nitrosopumilus sp.]|nr:divalent metal cation transporter [Nitrosopumilus sp.]MDH3489157.1 divalent metal cation transporter [Nitrosopumilus sp.]MDH3516156.1 divalent metal cation transporter [Nitrosopumilus sp.]MDH3565431.1 divalent metal cation transporter [Nitrosopumilus sp.]MDH5417043.1 divalent metal cation transporter [Nitrosopumilus sp.]
MINERLSAFSKTAGPGILFACTAIGVSHLVQSTRAGADFGLMIVGFVILVNLLKYPFFEYGSRYANATQTSIIDGYSQLGKPALWLYFLLTILSMFFVTGAVGFVTAGFFENLFGIDFLGEWTIVILFVVCVGILIIGKYNILDSLIKVIAIVLLVSTVAAFLFSIYNGPIEQVSGFEPKQLLDISGIFFLLALMGWMPTAVDLSSWNSLWTLERMKQTKYKPHLKETLFEFRLGYFITSVLAVMFVILGTFIFYGSGEELPNNNSDFAHKVVTLYTKTIGDWSYIIIAASAFSVMFGTIIAVFDGYSRSLQRTIELIFFKKGDKIRMKFRTFYTALLIIIASGSFLVISQFGDNLKELVDFATVLSFVIAPIIAIFNVKLVNGKFLDKKYQPSVFLKILSYTGIIFLSGFAILFLIIKFFSGL